MGTVDIRRPGVDLDKMPYDEALAHLPKTLGEMAMQARTLLELFYVLRLGGANTSGDSATVNAFHHFAKIFESEPGHPLDPEKFVDITLGEEKVDLSALVAELDSRRAQEFAGTSTSNKVMIAAVDAANFARNTTVQRAWSMEGVFQKYFSQQGLNRANNLGFVSSDGLAKCVERKDWRALGGIVLQSGPPENRELRIAIIKITDRRSGKVYYSCEVIPDGGKGVGGVGHEASGDDIPSSADVQGTAHSASPFSIIAGARALGARALGSRAFFGGQSASGN